MNEKCLDIGCGDGSRQEIDESRRRLINWLQENGNEYSYGIDADEEKINKIKQNIKNGTNFLVADANNLPFEDETFEIIHCWGVLHHIKEYKNTIKEIRRVLKNDGKIIIIESVDNCLEFRVARRIIGNWQGCKIQSFFKSETLKRELENENFQILKEEYYYRSVISDLMRYFCAEPRWSLIINDKISKISERLHTEKLTCAHYSVVCKKNVN